MGYCASSVAYTVLLLVCVADGVHGGLYGWTKERALLAFRGHTQAAHKPEYNALLSVLLTALRRSVAKKRRCLSKPVPKLSKPGRQDAASGAFPSLSLKRAPLIVSVWHHTPAPPVLPLARRRGGQQPASLCPPNGGVAPLRPTRGYFMPRSPWGCRPPASYRGGSPPQRI